MVLEHLFPENWLEKKVRYAFLLGFVYSMVGILLARLVFGSSSGIASVIFTSLLLIPSLRKLFSDEEKIEERERKFSFKHLYRDNKRLIQSYIGVFIGVFVAYYGITFFGMLFGFDMTGIFKEQLFLDPAVSGRASFSFSAFWSILENNWWVLVACFLLSIISGNGATFFIVWNASAWASIFAFRAVLASAALNQSPFVVGAIMQSIVLPHTLIEGLSYILAGIAGAVISRDVISKAKSLRSFILYFVLSLAFFFFVNWVLSAMIGGLMLFVLRIILFCLLIYLLKHSFSDSTHREVFAYNYYLFLVAVAVFVFGVLVETLVLSNSSLLALYYSVI